MESLTADERDALETIALMGAAQLSTILPVVPWLTSSPVSVNDETALFLTVVQDHAGRLLAVAEAEFRSTPTAATALALIQALQTVAAPTADIQAVFEDAPVASGRFGDLDVVRLEIARAYWLAYRLLGHGRQPGQLERLPRAPRRPLRGRRAEVRGCRPRVRDHLAPEPCSHHRQPPRCLRAPRLNTDHGRRSRKFCAMAIEHTPDLDAAATLWTAFRATCPATPAGLPAVGPFVDGPELADRLLALVVAGRKRATSTMLAEFEAEGEEPPRIGEHWIVTDSAGRPRVVLRTIELRIGPFLSVDAALAFDEGEDDRTRASWIREHRTYWQRQCARLGIAWSDGAEILFERFEVRFIAP